MFIPKAKGTFSCFMGALFVSEANEPHMIYSTSPAKKSENIVFVPFKSKDV